MSQSSVLVATEGTSRCLGAWPFWNVRSFEPHVLVTRVLHKILLASVPGVGAGDIWSFSSDLGDSIQ